MSAYIIYSKQNIPLIAVGSLERARQHAMAFGPVFGCIMKLDRNGMRTVVI